jgi:nicotinamide-nucleotide amidase
MNAEIISVGTELLLGQIVDTDAVFLAQMLSRLGINLYYRTTVGDNPQRLQSALDLAFSRADLVITIGGLGPTQDDLTKEAVAEALGDTFVMDEDHLAWLQKRMTGWGQENVPESFWKQALVPKHGRGLPNTVGTALGALFEKDGKAAVCLPGPPNELIPMAESSLEPYLLEKTAGSRTVILSRTLRIAGMGESQVEELAKDLMASENPTVAPYAKTGEVHLRVTARAGTTEEAVALIRPREAALRKRLGAVVYGVDDETLESIVVGMLTRLGQSLALAESCTGGLIAKRLTDVPNASRVFGLGLVTYSNEAKTEFLGVTPETLAQFGAVSSQTAKVMAIGARLAGKADLGLSVTGIAGPGGGSDTKPVGTVHIGLAWDDKVTSEQYHLLGSRVDIAYRASQNALALVRRFLLDPTAPEFRDKADV